MKTIDPKTALRAELAKTLVLREAELAQRGLTACVEMTGKGNLRLRVRSQGEPDRTFRLNVDKPLMYSNGGIVTDIATDSSLAYLANGWLIGVGRGTASLIVDQSAAIIKDAASGDVIFTAACDEEWVHAICGMVIAGGEDVASYVDRKAA